MRILNQLPPARQAEATEPSAPSVETAMRAEDAFEGEQTKALEGHSLKQERLTLLAQRALAFAGGASASVMVMLGLGSVAVGDALAGQIQGWVTIFGVPFFGLTSIYAWQLSRQYGDALLSDYAFACTEAGRAQQDNNILADEIISIRKECTGLFRAYRAAVAAVPAAGDAGADFAPAADVISISSRRDH